MDNIEESVATPNVVPNEVSPQVSPSETGKSLDQDVAVATSELPGQDDSEKRKGKIALVAGIVVAVVNLALAFLKLPFYEIVSLVTGLSFLIALALLVPKQYRYISRKYLLGLFGTLVGLGIISFVAVFVLAAIGK
ncbi:hypothetical protein ACFL0Y_02540 [Patescibacteria group bacterium]